MHLNLHGYPAHEWTRPLSGYVPRGFELWTIPKGFFLILRYHPGWQNEAMALLHAVCTALNEVPGLTAFNARQMALYECHAGTLQFEVLHGTAYTATEIANPDSAPVTLITEQFLGYIRLLERLDLEVASEFIVMAAHLIVIKSRMLLPVQMDLDDELDDPRHELIEKLIDSLDS